jgi:hypothetical protein
MATSKSLKTAVKKEVKQAETDAKTGNVETRKAPEQPTDLATGARSHPPEGFPR